MTSKPRRARADVRHAASDTSITAVLNSSRYGSTLETPGSAGAFSLRGLGHRNVPAVGDPRSTSYAVPMSGPGTLEAGGWTLVSAEDRQRASPYTFQIPSLVLRSSLSSGDAAKLLFDIETREHGQVIDRGVDRMWVIVKARVGDRYLGVLESDPGTEEGLHLQPGDEIEFGPEHVIEIQRPPPGYVHRKYGFGGLDD